MPSDPVAAGRKGGKIGGARNTPAQQAARKRNGFQPRTKAEPVPTVEQLRRVINAVPAPSTRKAPNPKPTAVPDEMAQEETSDDFAL